jgi:hypothetical protein
MSETVEELKEKIKLYEQNGAAKLFYAINRKMSEMAELMNKTNLSNLNLDDKEGKSFDRLFKLLEKSQVISNAAQTIQGFAGITNDEAKDTQLPKFRISPESMAQSIGDIKSQEA